MSASFWTYQIEPTPRVIHVDPLFSGETYPTFSKAKLALVSELNEKLKTAQKLTRQEVFK
jgi:hypothetical protein